ncbi:MAG: MMPL family transporter, partial [Deltaproteobacteria bacterium]|nr:MMPL family transporter [Deltaproteobacteria bacterium]
MNRSLEAGMKKPGALPEAGADDFQRAIQPLSILRDYLNGEDLSEAAMAARLNIASSERSTMDDEGYLQTDDGKMHVMLIHPLDRRQDYKVAQQLVKWSRVEIEQVRKEYPEVTIGLTGGPALNNDQFEISKKDMTLASIFAYFSTGIIFILAFRSFGRPLLGLLTLSLSLTCVFGLTTLTIGHLNIFSMSFIVILVGQGTYYGVHVVARYEEELLRGLIPAEAMEETLAHVFGNITTSTLTTAAAFFATTLVSLKGFAELGWIAGMGVMISSLGMQLLLPALLLLYDRKGARGILDKKKIPILNVSLKKKWISLATGMFNRHAWLIILMVAVFMASSSAEARQLASRARSRASVQRVEWLDNVFPESNVSESTQEKLRRAILALPVASLRAPEPSDLIAELTRLRDNLQKVEDLALASPHGEKLLPIAEEGIGTLEKLLKQGLTPPPPLPTLEEFQRRFFGAIRGTLTTAARTPNLTLGDIPVEMRAPFLSADRTYAIYVFPSGDIWESVPLENFVSDMRKISPDVTGPPIMFFEILQLVRYSYFKIAGYSALAIFAIFLLDFRSLRYALMASFPLVLGVFCLFGLMSALRLPFNTANMVALPMVLGIGADNGVHLIHRFIEEKEKDLTFLFRSTGKALIITYLDTLTSFLGLAVAHHQGMAHLGQVVLLGITCCTVCGVLFLPAVMSLMIKSARRPLV